MAKERVPAKAEAIHSRATVRITVTRSYKVDGTLKELMTGGKIPGHAHVVVHVPGGGDYSNMALSWDEVQATATWETEDTE